MTRLQRLLIAALTALSGCSRGDADAVHAGARNDSVTGANVGTAITSGVGVATAGPIVPVSGASPAQNGGACPRTGLWAECSVEKRLTQAGFVVRHVLGYAQLRAGFSVRPAVYTLGKSRLEVFIYPSQAAANADARKIDTVAAAPKGTATPWPMPPTFVRSANLLAVFLTDNPTQAERLALALTAGAPQP